MVVGAGGHAKVALATARSVGRNVVAVLDDRTERFGELLDGIAIQGPIHEAIKQLSGVEVFLAIGNNRARADFASLLSRPFATLVHPFSWVAPDVRLEEGSLVCAGAVIQPGARVGRHCIVNTSSSTDHDCVLADFTHVSPGVRLAGGVIVGEGSHVGIGASVIQGVQIGAWSTVGAGAAVVRDVPAYATVKGVPAR